ncbi:MAG: adenylyl-sulfate kinase [Akkermansiaceae bacterium]
MTQQDNIHPEFSRQLGTEDKETLLSQRGIVLWLCGLSGSGKSTLANALERSLHAEGKYVVILDGDNLRSGLNADLGFSDEDRNENIRRTAEVAKIFSNNGAIVILSLITPQEEFRAQARNIIGDRYQEIYIKADFETCMKRDVKGLYAKQAKGEIKNFTGAGSNFVEPVNPELVIDTTLLTEEASLQKLIEFYKTTDHGKL